MRAQEADTAKNAVRLDDVVISANRVEESRKMVPQEIVVLDRERIIAAQAQTTGDLIATANVLVQKSQMGGGTSRPEYRVQAYLRS